MIEEEILERIQEIYAIIDMVEDDEADALMSEAEELAEEAGIILAWG